MSDVTVKFDLSAEASLKIGEGCRRAQTQAGAAAFARC